MGEGGGEEEEEEEEVVEPARAEDDKVKPLLGFVVYCRLNYKKRITLKTMRLAPAIQKGT